MMHGSLTVVFLSTLVLVAGCYNPDSFAICDSNSHQAAYARALTPEQLRVLHADSVELMSSAEESPVYADGRVFPDGDTLYPAIPKEFAYLNPVKIRAAEFWVGFHLKGCLDEDIYLHVMEDEIALTYAPGGGSEADREILWSPGG